MSTTNADRVGFSYNFKIPGEQEYSTIGVSVSIETDRRPDETSEQAMERARAFVLAQADMPAPPPPVSPRASLRGQSKVDDEAFDPSNPVHYRIAQSIFDTEKIKSEKSREYKLYKLLPGERVADIGRIVRDDMAAFRGDPARVGRRDGAKSGWDGRWPRRG